MTSHIIRIGASEVIDNMWVDSLVDIVVNKLLTVSQRSEVKDFVDLYFLLQQFNLWDLITGVKVKFGIEVEPMLLAADFTKVEDFTFLPKMLKPLTLSELQGFFQEQTKQLGQMAVERNLA